MKESYFKPILFLLLAIFLPIFVIFVGVTHPYLNYEGDKTVPKEDVIHYGYLTFRDLRMDEYTTCDGKNLYVKVYLLKGSILPKKLLLQKYCKEQFDACKTHDIMSFRFYRVSGKMPWFWKDEEPFPDLEQCADNMLSFWVESDGIMSSEKD